MPNPMEEMEAMYGEGAAMPAEKAPSAPPPEQGEKNPTEAFTMLQEALSNLNAAVQGAQAIPPEAQKALGASLEAYNAFMAMTGEAMGLPMGQKAPEGPIPADMPKGAMPADMPAGKGMKPVAV